MHNNFYLLQDLGRRLKSQWIKGEIISCYSQDKDELVLGILKGSQEFYIHAVLRSDLSVLRFPHELQRARKNSIDLFTEVLHRPIEDIFCYPNERCLGIILAGSWELIFKMFGNHANVILCHQHKPKKLFKNQLVKDWKISPLDLSREIDTSKEKFEEYRGHLRSFLPTLGGKAKEHLDKKGYTTGSLTQQWKLLQDLLQELQDGHYFLKWHNGLPILTLFDPGQSFFTTDDVMKALNEFYYRYVTSQRLLAEKKRISNALNQQLKRSQKHLLKTEERMRQIEKQLPYQVLADMIMAYMHQIPKGATSVKLPHFETNQPVEIKLKSHQSPQKNAENLYRKAKNQKKEINILKATIKDKRQQISQLTTHLALVSKCDDLKELLRYSKSHSLIPAKKHQTTEEMFKSFQLQGFTILVGRNAANNDLLTQRYAHKDDLWLHAKDVKGSHVVIKHQSGHPFPAPVIHRAAELAAFYSKRKQDSICPVAYTLKKHVRKPKGAAPGQVVLEKEQVLLVEPRS